MSKVGKETQRTLLDSLSSLGYGQAESESEENFVRGFYPVSQHLRAFEPDVMLVVGERGTGKSALFNAVFTNELLTALAPFAPELQLPRMAANRVKWVPGYPSGAQFPDPRGLKAVLKTAERAVEFWFAFLVRALGGELDDAAQLDFLDLPGGAPDRVLAAFTKSGNDPLLALDRLDAKLQEEDRWLFVGYDELDTLGGFEWKVMTLAIQGLVAFWSSYARRWKRLRAKIFLRTDLFRRHAGLGGADLAKLAANRVELVWNDQDLFSMLIKRISNTDKELFEYCKSAKVPFVKEPHKLFGHIPNLTSAESARPFIERLVGHYMGANPNKGQSFNWVLDHLRDAHKRATPRSLVRLFEQAAQKERGNPRSTPPRLLHPTSLRQALEDVSTDHVMQAIHNEWPWLHGVKERIVKDRLAPWRRAELQELLSHNWNQSWGGEDKPIYPPTQTPKELLDYLLELGVFRERSNDRIDVPDIYLFGLGLRRKGGVKRR